MSINVTFYETSTGRITGSATVHGTVAAPDGEAWIEGVHSEQTHYVKDGVAVPFPARPGPWATFDFVSEEWVDLRSPEEIAADLQRYKASSLALVVKAIAQIREVMITDLPGQQMIYLAKEAEAKMWIAATEPDLADYPLMAAEVGITASTAADLAAMWVALSAAWRAAAAQLENIRFSAGVAIAAATDEAAIDAAVTAALTALEG